MKTMAVLALEDGKVKRTVFQVFTCPICKTECLAEQEVLDLVEYYHCSFCGNDIYFEDAEGE